MKILLCTLAAAMSLQPAVAASSLSRPVRIGTGGAELAGCTSVGRVKPMAGTIVRAAPNSKAAARETLKRGAEVFICEQREGSAWLGIVYGAKGIDCGTTDTVAKPRPYVGRCKSGWVATKHIDYIAG